MKKIEIDKELKKILNTQTLLKFPDGCKFTGMTKKKGNRLIPHGLGFGLWPNGHSYKGQYKNGQFDGWGNYISPGNYEYSGLWKKNYMSGYGEIKYSNSQTYKGEFKNSKKNGYGTLIVSDQFKTEGKWKDDKLHGEGKITFLKDIDDEEKGTIIKGNYVKGNLHGPSEKIYPDGDILYCVYDNGVLIKARFRGEKKWKIIKK